MAPAPTPAANAPASSAPGRFPTPPDRAFVQAFLAHLAATDRPEDFPGLDKDSPPPKTGEHRLLCKVDASGPRRAAGDRVPCAACSGDHGKGLAGRLLWSSDERVRIVGHICCRRHLGKAVYDAADREMEREQQKAANENFLLENIATLPAWLADLGAFGPLCAEFAKVHAKLHSGAPLLMTRFARAFREHGGHATVQRRRVAGEPADHEASPGEPAEHDEVQLALLGGEPMTNPHFHPHLALAQLLRRLVTLLGGRDGEISDAAISELLDELSGTEEKLADAAKAIRTWSRDAEKFVGELAEARRFFARDNLAALQAWGAHAENDDPFVVDPLPGNITFRGQRNDHATVAMPSARIPATPSFAMIQDG
jgi:hypothetical protein